MPPRRAQVRQAMAAPSQRVHLSVSIPLLITVRQWPLDIMSAPVFATAYTAERRIAGSVATTTRGVFSVCFIEHGAPAAGRLTRTLTVIDLNLTIRHRELLFAPELTLHTERIPLMRSVRCVLPNTVL
jgi:hypothetical protein